ncbi:macrophage colony-stimulating factor 1 isoform X1 [Struthio camelus]|uniref:macrophage colony-stimulating factor 1 isoform X1 n=1 Tax=Struthio camelus TaxID=8801 RepID=UPI0036042DCC
MPRLGAKVCLLRCTLLSSLLFLLVCSIHETEQNSYCQQIITQKHLAELQELADTQMQHPGRVSFRFIDKVQLDDPVCYVKAAFPLLGEILGKTEFKENSSNAKKLQTVRRMYSRIDENVDPCIREEDDEERELSQKCFREFTTSPYEMLALVKQFFHDIDLLLQTKETFEKDCSHVYRKVCLEPEQTSSPLGVGTDGDCNGLSPALPSATQPSLSAAARAGREAAAASARVPYGLLRAALAGLDGSALAQPPASTDGGSGTEEVLGATASPPAAPVPAMQQPARAVGAETLPDPPGTVVLAAEDVSIPPGDGGMAERGPQGTEAAVQPPEEPAEHRGAAVLPDAPGTARGLGPPDASPSAGSARARAEAPGEGSGARILPGETPEPGAQLRFSRTAVGPGPPAAPERQGWAPGGRQPPGPGAGARGRAWGLSRLREPEDGGAGPSFDSHFVLSAEQHRKEPKVTGSHREPLIYVAVASVVAVLLAVGGLLFYKYRSRALERRLDESERDPEEPERRALQGARGRAELETQQL